MHYESPYRRKQAQGHPHQQLIADLDEKRNVAKGWAEEHERKAASFREAEANHQHAMDALLASWSE